MGYHKTLDLINDLKQHIEFDSKMSFQSNPIACQFSSYTRGEKISVRSSNHLTHLIPSKEMTIEEAMQNFRAIREVLYVPKCL